MNKHLMWLIGITLVLLPMAFSYTISWGSDTYRELTAGTSATFDLNIQHDDSDWMSYGVRIESDIPAFANPAMFTLHGLNHVQEVKILVNPEKGDEGYHKVYVSVSDGEIVRTGTLQVRVVPDSSEAIISGKVEIVDNDYSLRFVEGNYITTSQYSAAKATLQIKSLSNMDQGFKITASSQLPVTVSPAAFALKVLDETQLVEVAVDPQGAKPELYAVNINIDNGFSKIQRTIAVKVEEGQVEKPLQIDEVAQQSKVNESQPYKLKVVLSNTGKYALENVALYVAGIDVVVPSPFGLNAGEKKVILMESPGVEAGLHEVYVKAVSGKYEDEVRSTVTVEKNYTVVQKPVQVIDTALTVEKSTKDGKPAYSIIYAVKNKADKPLKSLRVEIEDAPANWQIFTSPIFEISPNERRELELMVVPDKEVKGNVTMTVSLYADKEMLRSQEFVISEAGEIAALTGLMSLGWGGTIGWLILIIIVGVALYAYRTTEERGGKKPAFIKEQSPNYIKEEVAVKDTFDYSSTHHTPVTKQE